MVFVWGKEQHAGILSFAIHLLGDPHSYVVPCSTPRLGFESLVSVHVQYSLKI